ncbi:MFS transporter [Thermanaeromonas sp. C210]|uniref:MFS transporter n=1 Tax=Thermanaeromonas sp. C210 TaxID=2731925 RepID=UPI00155C6D8B|nr:MFS transporter [Thermanaeromonas sp. C210]GFN23403.1 MFS transporter [Thermanaeromonas sp. C210]
MEKPKTKWRIRYTALICMWIAYCMLQLDRQKTTVLMPVIREDIGLDHAQIGILIGTFTLIFATMQFISGYIVNRVGLKRVMAVALAGFSVSTWWTGFVTSFESFLFRYAIFGWFEGLNPPAAVQLVSRWFPKRERGKASAVWATTWVITPIWAPIVAVALMNATSWRWVFGFCALAGLPALLLIKYFIFDRPEQYRFKGKTMPEYELEEIYEDEIAEEQKKNPAKVITYKDVINKKDGTALRVADVYKNVSIWLLSLAAFFHNTLFWGMNIWLPLYLTEVHKYNMQTMAILVGLYNLSGAIGQFLCGAVSDRIGVRRPFMIASNLLSLLFMILFVTLIKPGTPFIVTALLLLVTGFFLNMHWAVQAALSSELSSPDLGSVAIGVVNGMAQYGSAAAGYVTGFLVYKTPQGTTVYDNAFIYWGLSALLAALFVYLIKEKSRKVPEAAPQPVKTNI